MKRKWMIGIIGGIAVILVFIGLFRVGSHYGAHQSTSTKADTQQSASKRKTDIVALKYTKSEYAMMAVVDYNDDQRTNVNTLSSFIDKKDHFEVIDSNGPAPMKVTVNHTDVLLIDEDGHSHEYKLAKLNQQLKSKQNRVDRLIKKEKSGVSSSTSTSSSSSSMASSSGVDTHNLTNAQAIDWIWYYYNSSRNNVKSTETPTGDDGEPMVCDNQYDGGLSPSDGLLYFRTQDQNGSENAWWRINDQGYLQEGIGVDDNDSWETVATSYMSDN